MPIRIVSRRERKSPRLAGFDYSSRCWYFVTIIARRRQKLFGALGQRGVILSDIGRIVAEEWKRSAVVRSDVDLDEFVVMPDHFHALVGLRCMRRSESVSSLTRVIGAFKGAVTRRLRKLDPGYPHEVWQRSFHDSIIRGPRHFECVRHYISANPVVAWMATRWPG